LQHCLWFSSSCSSFWAHSFYLFILFYFSSLFCSLVAFVSLGRKSKKKKCSFMAMQLFIFFLNRKCAWVASNQGVYFVFTKLKIWIVLIFSKGALRKTVGGYNLIETEKK
jgi:hypothetical protein